MRVYHASSQVVASPDVLHSRSFLDFGKGFYVTTLREQAFSYSKRFVLRNGAAVVNEYELDVEALERLSVKRFGGYDEEWLDFVSACRRDEDATLWDVVVGGVADDKVFRTIDLYFAGEMSKADALGRLRYEKPNDQICLRTQQAIDSLLRFVSSEEVR